MPDEYKRISMLIMSDSQEFKQNAFCGIEDYCADVKGKTLNRTLIIQLLSNK